MKIAIGADHGGFALKQELNEHLRRQGKEAFDLAARRGDASTGGGEFPL